MNNLHLNILGSSYFSKVLDEVQFSNLLNVEGQFNLENKKILIKILFPENLKIRDVKTYLQDNVPVILFLKDKDFLKKKKLRPLSFHVTLELPIEILSLKEILNVLAIKYNFLKKSEIFIKDYKINSNERSITKNKIKVRLTEKELELILVLNKSNGVNKSFLLKRIWKHTTELDTHAFETHLYRLRKKINKYFNDSSFIIEKNSFYYLNKLN